MSKIENGIEMEVVNKNENQEVTLTSLEIMEKAIESFDGTEEVELIEHERSHDKLTVRSILKRYGEKRIQIPLCQRLYVWTKSKRESLLDTIFSNKSLGLLTLGEVDKQDYLVDGLQRLTSLGMLVSEYGVNKETQDKETQDEFKKIQTKILNFQILVETIHDMKMKEIPKYFQEINSGVAVSAAVKERTKLDPELGEAVVELSGRFRDFDFNETAKKNAHHELISEVALLVASETAFSELKAKSLCLQLNGSKNEVLENVENAKLLLDKVYDIYTSEGFVDGALKRSLNINFIGVLLKVINQKEIENEKVVKLINYIFNKSRAIKEYAETTRDGAASRISCEKRFVVLNSLLDRVDELQIQNQNVVQETNQEIEDTMYGEIIEKEGEVFRYNYNTLQLEHIKENEVINFMEVNRLNWNNNPDTFIDDFLIDIRNEKEAV